MKAVTPLLDRNKTLSEILLKQKMFGSSIEVNGIDDDKH